jgi:hypothetical protein
VGSSGISIKSSCPSGDDAASSMGKNASGRG